MKNRKGELVATTHELAAEITLSQVQNGKSMGEYRGPVKIGYQ